VKVHEALSAVMADVQAVGKNDRNTEQGWSFRGVDAVVNAVGPALRKHGVTVVPKVLACDRRDIVTRLKNGNERIGHECVVTVEFRIIGPEGDELIGTSVGESIDYGDKATAQAMSVAYRTWWLQLLCIPTDEPDPDEHVVERAPERPTAIPVSHAKQDIVRRIEQEYPGLTPDEVKAVALDVWEWGAIVGDEIGPGVLADLLGHVKVAATDRIRAEAEAPNQ